MQAAVRRREREMAPSPLKSSPSSPEAATLQELECEECDEMQCGHDKTKVMLVAAPEVKKKKHQPPQEAIDEFWAKFNAKVPGAGILLLTALSIYPY